MSKRASSSKAANSSPMHLQLIDCLTCWFEHHSVHDDFLKLHCIQPLLAAQNGDKSKAIQGLLSQAIENLREQHPSHADVLAARMLSDELVRTAALRLNLSVANFHRKREESFPWLADEIEELEDTFRAEYRKHMTERLPQQRYASFIGRRNNVQRLTNLLLKPDAPWLVAITGIGGIGKTTFADVIVRQMIDNPFWAAIGWVTAPPCVPDPGETFDKATVPALTTPAFIDVLAAQLIDETTPNGRRTPAETLALLEALLKKQAHFIVIDNLETVADLKELLPILRQLANPSKFLLTSRSSDFDIPDLYHQIAPELDDKDALALLRAEAQLRNIPHLCDAGDDELLPIYAMVGGNALALKLICGQIRIYPLKTVLEDLLQARGKRIEELYEHIYRRAWNLLGNTAQSVLLAMPLVSEQGGDFELIKAMCELPGETLDKILELLIGLNLVEVRGDLHQRRYTIHNLTRTFLHEAVLEWQRRQ